MISLSKYEDKTIIYYLNTPVGNIVTLKGIKNLYDIQDFTGIHLKTFDNYDDACEYAKNVFSSVENYSKEIVSNTKQRINAMKNVYNQKLTVH